VDRGKRDEQDKPLRDPGSITYSAAIESAAALDTGPERSEFAERVLREATRRGFTQASRCVVLGDGSAWIWNTAAELFPQAIQILDCFHAIEHLRKVGRVIYCDSKQKHWSAPTTSGTIEIEYVTRSFANKAYAPPLASWRPVAK
jgi:hypothetical protein